MSTADSDWARAANRWADANGFGPEVAMGEVRKTELPASSPKLSGWYLLRFHPHSDFGDTFYLGESVDLRSRMAGHMGTAYGKELHSVRILPKTVSKQELRAVERRMIRELEREKVKLRNNEHASVTFGTNALSELISDEDQQQWLRDPSTYNANQSTPLKSMDSQAIRYATAADNFRNRDDHNSVTDLLRTYLEHCVPAPRATEYQYWAVSSGTYSGSRFPRVFCVNVGMMETFVVQGDKKNPGEVRGFVNVRESVLIEASSERRLQKEHPGVTFYNSYYEDAGADMVQLEVRGLESLQRLLADPAVQAAAARLVLDVMRKHFCVYTRYHCPQLVEDAYDGSPRVMLPTESAADLSTIQVIESDVEEAEFTESPAVSMIKQFEQSDDASDLGDVEIYWITGFGAKKTGRNQLDDFRAAGEWRMDPDPRYQAKVADMRPGERIAVRTRSNTTKDVPFDHRGHKVSVMNFYLRGTILSNPGDGCSVKVDWDTLWALPLRYYLYTSQDTVWPIVRGVNTHWNDLAAAIFDDAQQDVNYFRNHPFWSERFGDR
ncbi:MAG: hypothetical protein C0482_05000 [Gordonia sp.]|nr:hypothetical protein [Gordonia sp. (in: high G+C Gram-positive bacteria)]